VLRQSDVANGKVTVSILRSLLENQKDGVWGENTTPEGKDKRSIKGEDEKRLPPVGVTEKLARGRGEILRALAGSLKLHREKTKQKGETVEANNT